MACSERYVVLKGGLSLPVEPIVLAIELEARGLTVRREPGDVLSVQPHQQLTADDCQRIRRWKPHLLAMCDYMPPEETVQ